MTNSEVSPSPQLLQKDKQPEIFSYFMYTQAPTF